MRYELTDHEWAATSPMLRNKPRGILRVNDRRVNESTLVLVGGAGQGHRLVGGFHDVGWQRGGALQEPGELVAGDFGNLEIWPGGFGDEGGIVAGFMRGPAQAGHGCGGVS